MRCGRWTGGETEEGRAGKAGAQDCFRGTERQGAEAGLELSRQEPGFPRLCHRESVGEEGHTPELTVASTTRPLTVS